MYKVLIANSNFNELNSYYNYLDNDKNLSVHTASSSTSAINIYNELNPDVLVLDTNLSNANNFEIIEKLSVSQKESNNCNIILTANKTDKIFPIANAEKISKILYKKFPYENLKSLIGRICKNNNISELNEIDLQTLLLSLNLNIWSTSTKYLVEAIYQCYYYPNLLNNLDNVVKIISYKNNTDSKTIKFALRNSLKPLNNFRYSVNHPIMALFDETRNITPKYFLEVLIIYLYKKNQKKLEG